MRKYLKEILKGILKTNEEDRRKKESARKNKLH
jgi:hypothetical protein